MTPTTTRPQKNSTSQMGKDPEEKQDKVMILEVMILVLMCSLQNDAGLTSVGDSMYLTAAVHSYTQQGCFIIPFDIFAFQRVRQEGQVCHNNAM